ncbi:MAG: hypothetical protein M5U28_37085 [Sandaracinaceae bacterium]|nr:hypothetical protein [Sandaracinaceae bacterium]
MVQGIIETRSTIVVADDDADVRELVVEVLRSEGHHVEWEGCGASLLWRLARRPTRRSSSRTCACRGSMASR